MTPSQPSSAQPRLSGRTAFVTGAASGIGRECAALLAGVGAAVAVADRDLDGASRAAEEIGADGAAIAVELDVTDPSSCGKAVETASETLGPIAVLVNCAGVWSIGSFGHSSEADWLRDIDVNLLGTMRTTHAALPQLRDQGGSIVNIASDAGRVGEAGLVAYSAAKGGVIAFTKALAREVGRAGVRANCVAPSMVRTPANADAADEMPSEQIEATYPLGRIGQPIDIASAVLFLASPMSGWVTGQIVSVNGGYSTAG